MGVVVADDTVLAGKRSVVVVQGMVGFSPSLGHSVKSKQKARDPAKEPHWGVVVAAVEDRVERGIWDGVD